MGRATCRLDWRAAKESYAIVIEDDYTLTEFYIPKNEIHQVMINFFDTIKIVEGQK